MIVLGRIVFVLLVVGTVSAFFISQKLKSAPVVIEALQAPPKYFSPNAKGLRSKAKFGVRMTKRGDQITVAVVNEKGDEVRRLRTDKKLPPYRFYATQWDGRSDRGAIVPNGRYMIRVSLKEQGRTIQLPWTINLKSTPPRPVVKVTPDVIGMPGDVAKIKVSKTNAKKPTILEVVRTDQTLPQKVARIVLPKGATEGVWNGKIAGRQAPAGTYLVSAQVEDRAGNIGRTPVHIPPHSGESRGRAGITVRRISIQPPLVPIKSGNKAEFFVDSRGRSYQWRIQRLGSGKVIKQGKAIAGKPLSVLVPTGPSGIYVLKARSGPDETRTPFLVQSQKNSPLLIVVPAISWVGNDRVDEEPRDGVPNTLNHPSTTVNPSRVLMGVNANGWPVGLLSEVAPLLAYLDRSHIAYDITSDYQLHRQGKVEGVHPNSTTTVEQVSNNKIPNNTDGQNGYRGIMLAGTFRWVPHRVAVNLRRYVSQGGKVAYFGEQTLRRGLTISRGRFSRPTQPADSDIFGFNLAPSKSTDASKKITLTALRDSKDLPLLTGIDGVLSGFSSAEGSLRSGSGKALLAMSQPLVTSGSSQQQTSSAPKTGKGSESTTNKSSANKSSKATDEAQGSSAPTDGKGMPRPVIEAVAYSKGVIIRVGLREWPAMIARDPKVAQITHNIADVLRGVTPRVREQI